MQVCAAVMHRRIACNYAAGIAGFPTAHIDVPLVQLVTCMPIQEVFGES